MTRRAIQHGRRGISLIEAAVSVAIVGGLCVAALNAAGQTMRARQATTDRARGLTLAGALMTEVRAKKFGVGTALPNTMLVSAIGVPRSSFDEVSDYDGFKDSPPTNAGGTRIAGGEWSRTVHVKFVTPSSPDVTSQTDTSVRRIDVTVTRNGRTVATLSSLRTGAGEVEPR